LPTPVLLPVDPPPPSPVIYGTGKKRLSSSVAAAVFLHSEVQ